MRKHEKRGDFSVTAISGIYVVILGINARESATKGLLGFAVHRTDHTEDEQYWLKGFKTFEETEPDPAPGALFSTLEHPIQSFLWADYTAKVNHMYTYKVVPLFGKPKNLQQGPPVEVEISTESEDKGTHATYFNRRVAGSQAYYRKFENKNPDEVENREAYKWLSRGLEEALLRFIKQADSSEYGLRAAVYEFNYMPVLKAFKEAANRGADVKIVYDSRQDNPREPNDEAIAEAGIRSLMIRRTQPKSYISHNKFVVLLKNGNPLQVWTGSTNFTRGGIFGQANVGHIVRDEEVARKYHEYWLQLANDPTNKDLRLWIEQDTPDPVGPPQAHTITPLFSPRKTLNTLNWYTERMDSAKQTICLTAAFGVNPLLAAVLEKDKDYLRYLLLERRGKNYNAFSRDRDVQIAVGSKFGEGALYRWTREVLTNFNFHVKYIHTKFMLIDPLSDNPTVISGSANFSDASTKKNDENMLVIQGDIRVADIYLGEFFRLFSHFYFRYVVNMQKAKRGTEERKQSYLKPDDSWTRRYYKPGSIKEKQRLLFGRDPNQPLEP
ncbi:MAG: phospholipase D-like domain-containing protein [Anaerolineae bacterium]